MVKEPKLIVAESCGFCFGVRRAVEMVYELRKKTDKKIYVIGELIHNEVFIKKLEKDGILCIEESALDELENEKDGIVLVIRTHGASKQLAEYLDEKGFEYVDATCPFVKRIHKIVDENSKGADMTLIAGDKNHPEVIGIQSYSHADTYVISDESECADFVNKYGMIGENYLILVSQTTNNNEKYVNCQKIIKKLYTNAKIFDTICNVTEDRQIEVGRMAEKANVMFVIGSTKSSNTKKLFDISKSNCANTYLLETADDIPTGVVEKMMREYTAEPDANDVGFTVGITAGASTPDDIIEEVKVRISNILYSDEKQTMDTSMINDGMSFEEMLDASFKTLRTGERVKGTITSVTPTEAHVDLGIKYTGMIPLAELTDDPTAKPEDIVKVGDEVDVVVVKPNDAEGTVLLSKKRIDADKNWEALVAAEESGEVLSGKVVEITRGGLVAFTSNGKVFIPISQTTLPRREEPYEEKDLQQFLGQTLEFKIIGTNAQKKRAVASVRLVVSERRRAEEAKFWESVEVGQKFTGKVKSITTYGAFVDLGPVDGMVHITELSWKRIKNPSEVVNIGDEIDVYIKALDPEKKRISLGHRVDADNPWTILADKYHVDDVIDVKVVSLTPFGAFAEVIPGIDGLIHISQISNKKIGKPADVLNVGDVVTVKITAIDFEAKKVSLSIRALLSEEEAEKAEEAPVEEAAVEEVAPVEEAPAEEAAESTDAE